VIVADLLVFSGNEVYLLPKKDDPLDPFEGDYRAPSTRIGKNDRVEESAEKIFEEEFGRAKEVEKTAVFDSEVEFRDGSRQHYILFFFKTEVDEDLEERGYRIDQLGSIELLPGLEKVIRKAKWSDSFFMGEWDIEETESGFSVRKQDF
jgi:ADP-ribose pyrophosphatase YjhB (NUDIX family)